MELAATRFVKIEGTRVTVAVDSADEARLAIKELRHKKKELAHIRRGLVRQRKAAEAIAARGRQRGRKAQGIWSRIGAGISMLMASPYAYGNARQIMTIPDIEKDCARVEELQLSVDTCLLQIEGKLLREG